MEILFIGKNIKDTLQPLWNEPYQLPTVNGHLPLSLTLASTYNAHQRLLEDEKPPTSEVDSYLKTATRAVHLWIDGKLKNQLLDCLYLSAKGISHNSYS